MTTSITTAQLFSLINGVKNAINEILPSFDKKEAFIEHEFGPVVLDKKISEGRYKIYMPIEGTETVKYILITSVVKIYITSKGGIYNSLTHDFYELDEDNEGRYVMFKGDEEYHLDD